MNLMSENSVKTSSPVDVFGGLEQPPPTAASNHNDNAWANFSGGSEAATTSVPAQSTNNSTMDLLGGLAAPQPSLSGVSGQTPAASFAAFQDGGSGPQGFADFSSVGSGVDPFSSGKSAVEAAFHSAAGPAQHRTPNAFQPPPLGVQQQPMPDLFAQPPATMNVTQAFGGLSMSSNPPPMMPSLNNSQASHTSAQKGAVSTTDDPFKDLLG